MGLNWPPRSRGETNYAIAKSCAVHFVRVLEIFLRGWTVSSQFSFQVFLTGYHETKGWFSLAHKHKHKPTYADAVRC